MSQHGPDDSREASTAPQNGAPAPSGGTQQEGVPAYPWGPPPGWGMPPAAYLGAPPAPKPPLPPFPHPEPREYHQMLRTWNYVWWKPVLGVTIVVAGMFLTPLLLMPVLVLGAWLEPGALADNFAKAANLEYIGPGTLLWLNLSLGASILVCWLVMRYVHRMRPRWLTSVVPKMRWKVLFIFIGISVIALIAQVLVNMLVSGSGDSDLSGKVNEVTSTTAILAVVILLTTPLQAAGEEYVFRGYLLQAIGSFWSASRVPPWVARWLAILVTAAVFAVAHGGQNFPLFFDRFTFGLIAGWLVIRTGGLEAGIAMHILNNFLALGYAVLFADLASALNVSGADWANVPVTLTQAGTYAILVTLVARKMDLQRRTAPPVDLQPQQPRPPEPVSSEA